MRWGKRALTALVVAFGLIQLIPATHSNPPEMGNPEAPTAILGLLRRACYDCHSNQTRWLWYSYVAPASWLVSCHVMEARRRLNFSEWEAYASDPDTASHKLNEIAVQVSSTKMVPWYYRAIHPEARLSQAERRELIHWAKTTAAAIRSLD
jgi:Haem-binding domain